MANSTRKRKAEGEEWEMHKTAILELYVKQDLSLKKVIASMASTGFSRTKPQYERALKSWEVTKNITAQEWKTISKCLAERRAVGKASEVRVRGIVVPPAKLEKETRRYGCQMTEDLFAEFSNGGDRAVEMVGIEIYSPPSSPSQLPHTDSEAVSDLTGSGHIFGGRRDIPATAAPIDIGDHISETDTERESSSAVVLSSTPPWLDGIASDLNAKIKSGYLRHHSAESISDGAVRRPPHLQLIRVFTGVVSDIVNIRQATPIALRLARHKDSLPVLQRLLQLTQVPAIRSLAQSILVPAASEGHEALVRLFIESGVDPNFASLEGGTMVTALQNAVQHQHRDLVEYLMLHGANDWSAEYMGLDGTIRGTILDIVIQMDRLHDQLTDNSFTTSSDLVTTNAYAMMNTILTFAPCMRRVSQDRWLRTLRLAILQNRPAYVDLIFQACPMVLQAAKTLSWTMFEAAALSKGTEMYEHLVALGFSQTATNEVGQGSALAAAVAGSNAQLVARLLARKFSLSGIAFGLGRTRPHEHITPAEERLRHVHGLAALHIAIRNRDKGLINMIIGQGGDVNQDCGVYPIQLAAWEGDVELVKLLIAAGAQCSAIVPEERGDLYLFGEISTGLAQAHAGRPAMRLAFERGFLTIVNVFWKSGEVLLPTDMQLSSSLHWDPLSIAVQRRRADLLQIALKQPRYAVHSGYSRPSVSDMLLQPLTITDLAIGCISRLASYGLLGRDSKPALFLADLQKCIGTLPLTPQQGISLLYLAVRESHQADLIWFLMSVGVNPFERIARSDDPGLAVLNSKYGLREEESAMEYAVRNRGMDALTLLLAKYPTTCPQNETFSRDKQLSAAFAAAKCTGNAQLEQIVLRTGLRVKDIDTVMGEEGYLQEQLYLALGKASKSGEAHHVHWLLQNGARPNSARSLTGENRTPTPLEWAAMSGRAVVVRSLLAAGAEVNTPPCGLGIHRTPLQLAAQSGNLFVAGMLLASRAEVGAPPAAYDGRTALEAAAEKGHCDMTQELLYLGAARDNKSYRRAIYRAERDGHHDVAQMIESWKEQELGLHDNEKVAAIMQSMTTAELLWANEASRQIPVMHSVADD